MSSTMSDGKRRGRTFAEGRPPSASSSKASAPQPQMTRIEETADYLEDLEKLLLTPDEQQTEGFYISPGSLNKKLRRKEEKCKNCHQDLKPVVKAGSGHELPKSAGSSQGALGGGPSTPSGVGSGALSIDGPPLTAPRGPRSFHTKDSGKKPGSRSTDGPCRFHTGQKRGPRKDWSCCGQYSKSPGCVLEERHARYTLRDVQRMAYAHPTPEMSNPVGKRHVVAFDCEMGNSVTGESEVISISVIDYFTGECLINRLVYPDDEIVNTLPWLSGITKHQLNVAEARGKCLMGVGQVREKMWEFVGPETIIVGHSLQNDMKCLGWYHGRIVDTFVVGKKRSGKKADEGKEEKKPEEGDNNDTAVLDKAMGALNTTTTPDGKAASGASAAPSSDQTPKTGGPSSKRRKRHPDGFSLQALVKRTIGREIQTRAHHSMEDAIATRDLLHWFITHNEVAQELVAEEADS